MTNPNPTPPAMKLSDLLPYLQAGDVVQFDGIGKGHYKVWSTELHDGRYELRKLTGCLAKFSPNALVTPISPRWEPLERGQSVEKGDVTIRVYTDGIHVVKWVVRTAFGDDALRFRLIRSPAPSADDRPEVFPGTMLREGDVVELASGPGCDQSVIESWNRASAPVVFRAGCLCLCDGEEVRSAWPQRHHWRLVADTIPSPPPTEPCPPPEPEESEFNPSGWGNADTVHLKGADCVTLTGFSKPRASSSTEKLVRVEKGTLVVEPRETIELVPVCAICKEPESPYRKLVPEPGGDPVDVCGDCAGAIAEAISLDSSPRFRGTRNLDPVRKLSPAVAYHLGDDVDVTGLPGHH